MNQSRLLNLPTLPIKDMVLFPGAKMPFVVGRPASVRTLELGVKVGDHLVLLVQRDPKEDVPKQESFYPVGTLALVESLVSLPKGFYKVGVKGVARVRLHQFSDEGDVLQAQVELMADQPAPGESTLVPAFLRAAEQYLARNPDAARLLPVEQLRDLSLGEGIDAVASLLGCGVKEKQGILEQAAIEARLHTLLRQMEVDAARTALERDLEEKTQQRLDEDHKQYVISEKMRVLQQEMGRKGEKNEIVRLREQVEQAGMTEEAKAKAVEELDRLETMAPQSAEATVSRSYIDWLLALPWKKLAEEHLDLDEAERVLDEDHAGLEKVKARILEYLAVMHRLKRQSQPAAEGEESAAPAPLRGPILCLVGPPGVGKTSLARSIARALNRPFVRLSLGGVRDEAEIRGHRRTYIGSMPGRIISLMKKAGVRNPLMLLDEIDKMASDWRGDPASALLEVLDPEQNNSFQDHYLDVGYDLSQVLFLATANVRDGIPQALDDRMEVIDLSGYTATEKRAIAQQHLVPKSLDRHGMKDLGIVFEDGAVDRIVACYTKEAGVRQLEREISACLRRLARHSLQPDKTERLAGEPFSPIVSAERLPRLLGPEKYLDDTALEALGPGVVHGLAWTPTGGDMLTIEVLKVPGKGNLKLTGKLGEVMQESAQLALTFVRSRAASLGLADDFLEKLDLHVHVPEGAIPKDGPSAGITLASALVSALTGIPARSDVAMTGELTLQGKVLPIGGLKEKLLAAHRMGIRTVLLPRENARHLEDVPAEVREVLTLHTVSHIDDVLPLVLSRMPEPR